MSGSKTRKEGFSVSIGAVLGGLMVLVLLFSLAVWISTFVLSENSLHDLKVLMKDEISRNAKSRLITILSEQRRVTDSVAAHVLSRGSLCSSDAIQMDLLSNASIFQEYLDSFLGVEGPLSSLSIYDPSTGALVGVFNSLSGSALANHSGHFQADYCPQSGTWSSALASSISLLVNTSGSSNSTIEDWKIQSAGVPTAYGFGQGLSRWPGLSHSQLAFGVPSTLPNSAKTPVLIYSTLSQSLVREVLLDFEDTAPMEAFIVDTSSAESPFVVASRYYSPELCDGAPFQDDCTTTACNDSSRSFASPAYHHADINDYVITTFSSWYNTADYHSFEVDSATRQTLVRITLPQGLTYGIRWTLVVSVGDSDVALNLKRSQTGIIIAFIVSAVIQVGIIVGIILLIQSPLKKLNGDISRAGNLDLELSEEEVREMKADRIGGFQILAEHYNHISSDGHSGDEDDEEGSERPPPKPAVAVKKGKEFSVFSEVSSLERGFKEMHTTIRSFSFYVPQDVVTRLVRKGELASLSMTYKFISLMFIDVEGFTTLTEKIRERRLVKILEIYFGICGECIGDTGGTVDKYIGDAVMAIWGAPTAVDNMNARACMAGLMIQNQINDPATQEIMGDFDFRIRIGIHGGRALCGNVGCRKRMNYTALGDSVNLAARLEALNKEYGTRIMISSQVARDVAGMCVTRQLGKVTVKGKSIATDVFELVGIHPQSKPLFAGIVDINDPARASAVANSNSPGGSTLGGSTAKSGWGVSTVGAHSQYSATRGDAESTAVGSDAMSGVRIEEELFTIEELLELCREELEVDDRTLDFCAMYSHAVQQYLRGEFAGSLETFGKCKKHLADDYSKDAMFRKKAMDNMIAEMDKILNSGFAGGMGAAQVREERGMARIERTAATAGASMTVDGRLASSHRSDDYVDDQPHPAMPAMA